MKILLSEIEHLITPDFLEEAHELMLATQEYDLNEVEDGYFHFISRQPDYHVEIALNKEGIASAKCHCAIFKKNRRCRHVIAALLLLRDQLRRNRKPGKKSTHDQQVMNEVLHKMNITQLRSFLLTYASSHSTFRAEVLSNFLHLTRHPDYHGLFLDLSPLDKYGKVRLNRNSIKTVRGVTATLLKQAQQLLKDKALSETLRILEAVILHLHRLWVKTPQFQEQLLVDMRVAYKLFEVLGTQHMAPRLQQRSINLALEVCSRDNYSFPSGMKPLISIVEPFLLEAKNRKSAFTLAVKKIQIGSHQQIQWASLIFRWIRLWSFTIPTSEIKKQLEKLSPGAVLESNQLGNYEDVVFLVNKLNYDHYPEPVNKTSLQAGLKAAKMISDHDAMINFANRLALHHLDQEAWNLLAESETSTAIHILKLVESFYPAGNDETADQFLLNGWMKVSNGFAIITRLKAMNQLELLMRFDIGLRAKFRDELENAYAEYILTVRETYGGIMARQKLNNIFGHLKGIDLYQSVIEKAKRMEKSTEEKEVGANKVIRGFVFDLDGVIVDTAIHHFQSWKKIMKELGVEIKDSDDLHTRGAGRMESLEYLLQQYKIQLTDEEKQYWASRKNDIYVEAINAITPDDLLPGALSFLKASRSQGLLLALGSASKNARPVLKKLGVEEYFDAILDGNSAKESKPHPEIFLNASAALGLDPKEVVVFEDAAKGIQAALAAGCYAVGIGDPVSLAAAHIVIPGLDHASPLTIIDRLV